MNKKLIVGALSVAMLATVDMAYADESSTPATEGGYVSPQEYHPYVGAVQEHFPFKVGLAWDIGVPSGMALGLQARLPEVPWFKLGLSGTYTLAPGIRGNLLIDPIRFPIAPVANVDVGHQFPFTVPGVNGKPGGQFDYVDLQAGLAFGGRDNARVLLLVGESYISGSTHNIQDTFDNTSGITIGSPTFKGWVPDAKLGFEFLF